MLLKRFCRSACFVSARERGTRTVRGSRAANMPNTIPGAGVSHYPTKKREARCRAALLPNHFFESQDQCSEVGEIPGKRREGLLAVVSGAASGGG
jgi:hypothetical protein